MEDMNVHADYRTTLEFGYSYMSPLTKTRVYRSTFSLPELQGAVESMRRNRPDIDQASVDYFIRKHTASRWDLVEFDTLEKLA